MPTWLIRESIQLSKEVTADTKEEAIQYFEELDVDTKEVSTFVWGKRISKEDKAALSHYEDKNNRRKAICDEVYSKAKASFLLTRRDSIKV